MPPPPPGAAAVQIPPPDSSMPGGRLGAARGCTLPSASGAEVRRLLADRAQLVDRLGELDAESERLTRAVQRVGGVDGRGRPFTGAPPPLITSTAALHERLDLLNCEMRQLTGTISAAELKIQEIEQPSRRRRVIGTLVLLVAIAAAVGAAVYLVVR